MPFVLVVSHSLAVKAVMTFIFPGCLPEEGREAYAEKVAYPIHSEDNILQFMPPPANG